MVCRLLSHSSNDSAIFFLSSCLVFVVGERVEQRGEEEGEEEEGRNTGEREKEKTKARQGDSE